MQQNSNLHQPIETFVKIDPLQVCVIILAYGARTGLLQKILASVFEHEAGHVIVVANAVTDETLQILSDLKEVHNGRLEIVKSEENIGSAGGYALGLSAAIENSYDYLWLLDDDNLPQKDSLASLLEAYSIHAREIRKEELVLQSFRKSLPEMLELVDNTHLHTLPRPASFIGFHVWDLWNSFCSKLFMHIQEDRPVSNHRHKFIRLHSAPYGGLFFHKKAIKKMGFPNSLLFLYADDFAYTLNFTAHGGTLLLVTDSRIIDLEPVWNAAGE